MTVLSYIHILHFTIKLRTTSQNEMKIETKLNWERKLPPFK